MYTQVITALALTGAVNAFPSRARQAAGCTQFPSNITSTIQNALTQINLLEQVTVQNTTSAKPQFDKTDAALDAVFLSISSDQDEEKVCNFKPLGNPANSLVDSWANRNIAAQLFQQVSLKLQIVEQDVVNCDHAAALKDFCDLEKFWINGDGADTSGLKTNGTAPSTGPAGSTGTAGSTGSTGQTGSSGSNGVSVISGPGSSNTATIISGPGSAGKPGSLTSTSVSTSMTQTMSMNGTATSAAPTGQTGSVKSVGQTSTASAPVSSSTGSASSSAQSTPVKSADQTSTASAPVSSSTVSASPSSQTAPVKSADQTTTVSAPVSSSTAPAKPAESSPNVVNISPAVPSGVVNAIQGKQS